jgi:hypothetical protein
MKRYFPTLSPNQIKPEKHPLEFFITSLNLTKMRAMKEIKIRPMMRNKVIE